MAEVNFKSLQHLHESLLQKQQLVSEENQAGFTKEVREYIEQAKTGGSNIPSTRERDQIRANLRYWANYIYAIDKTFPDTELAPSTATGGGSFWATSFGKLSSLVLGIVVLVSIGALLFRMEAPPEINETSTAVLPTAMIQTTSMPEPTAEIENTPTPLFVGSDVVLTSPENGESVTPKIVFKGAYTKLEAGASIHVFLIRSDRLYPIRDSFTVSEDTPNGDWEIPVALYLKPEELEKAENLAVVPATCFDNPCRETLVNAAESGLAIDELPSQFSFTLYRNSSRVVYRNAYHAVQELRLVYPVFDGTSYDLFTSKPDGSDPIQITDSPSVYEESPSLSPDGTKIAYVHNTHSIHIMDSNGQNDHEIINGDQNILENPQWSSDSLYISYASGDPSRSPNATYWSIHIYQIITGEDKNISGEPGPIILNRYHSWIPNSGQIVFNGGTSRTGTSGFIKASVDSLEAETLFFDTEKEEIQPNIKLFGNGYLLTYTVINPDFSHDIYAIIAPNGQISIDDSPVRLTRTTGGTDYPILEPDSRTIYFVRGGSIFRVEFNVEGNKIILIPGANINDGEYYGDLVVGTGTVTDNPSFDINYMDTYFPINR